MNSTFQKIGNKVSVPLSDDPFADYGGTFAFRTAGSGAPGGSFTTIPADAQISGSGNVFFGLKQ